VWYAACTVEKKPLTFSEKILLARNRLKEGQKAFGERFGVSRFAVKDWEKGKEPSIDHRTKLLPLISQMLGEEGGDVFEKVAYQLVLPFNEPVQVEFRILPKSETSVGFAIEAKKRAV